MAKTKNAATKGIGQILVVPFGPNLCNAGRKISKSGVLKFILV